MTCSLSMKMGLVAAGSLLLAGMLLGIWKYYAMLTSDCHRAPLYVDIAHRAAFLYSAACLVLAALAAGSTWPEAVNVGAMGVVLFYFVVAIAVYVAHGLRGTAKTQFAQRTFVTTWGMVGLILGEIGGTAVLLAGFVRGAMAR